MNLHLSSQIVLNKVPEQYYRPRTAVERSEITRCEKIFTDIYPKIEEGVKVIADAVEKEIKRSKQAGKKCVLALGTGLSLTPIYQELARRHKEEGLSFDNVVVFNAYEYFPLNADSKHSAIGQLRERCSTISTSRKRTYTLPTDSLPRTTYMSTAAPTNSSSLPREASTLPCSA